MQIFTWRIFPGHGVLPGEQGTPARQKFSAGTLSSPGNKCRSRYHRYYADFHLEGISVHGVVSGDQGTPARQIFSGSTFSSSGSKC